MMTSSRGCGLLTGEMCVKLGSTSCCSSRPVPASYMSTGCSAEPSKVSEIYLHRVPGLRGDRQQEIGRNSSRAYREERCHRIWSRALCILTDVSAELEPARVFDDPVPSHAVGAASYSSGFARDAQYIPYALGYRAHAGLLQRQCSWNRIWTGDQLYPWRPE